MNKQILQQTITEWHSKTPDSVHGVGYGYKTKNGIKTDELSVVFMVVAKKPLAELTQEEILPTSLIIDNETIKTDVIEMGTARATSECSEAEGTSSSDHRVSRRALRGGISIGHNEDALGYGNAGTLGGLFMDLDDGSVVGLTNLHVVCPYTVLGGVWSDLHRSSSNLSPYNTSVNWDIRTKHITQPGTSDDTTAGTIGDIKRYYPLVMPSYGYNSIDAAVIGINDFNIPELSLLDYHSGSQVGPTTPVNYGVATTAEIDGLSVGDLLFKSGRSTGYQGADTSCRVVIKYTNTALSSDYSPDPNVQVPLYFHNLIGVEYADRSSTVSFSGDSGSLLLADFSGVRKIIGLVFAGGALDGGLPDSYAVANRIDTVMSLLNLGPFDPSLATKTNGINKKNQWRFLTQAKRISESDYIATTGINNMKYWECGQDGNNTVYVTYLKDLSAPRNVVAAIGNASLVVSWDAPYSNGGSPITDYIVKSSSNGGVAMSWKNFSDPVSTATSCTVTGLINGTPYVFKVIAKNAVGISPASANSQPVTPATVPGKPTSVVAVSGNASLAVTWAAPDSTGGSPITDYLVQYSSNSGSTWTTFTDAVSTSQSLTITGLTNGTAYVIRVYARNAIGYGALPSDNSAPVTPATVPGSPTGVAAVRGNSSLAVTWTAPASNGGSAITDYLVKYSSNSGATFTTFVRSASTVPSVTVTGLTNGTPYVFKVIAKNAVGISLPSANSAPVTPATVSSSPTLVVAKTGIANSLAVTWIAPASTGGSPITDYLVKYSSNSGATFTTFVRSASTVPSVTVTGLTNGTPYVFKVIAKNAVGISPPSANSAPTTPLATVPSSPTAVVATSGDSSLAVTWTSPANTGGSNITAYIIKYSSNSGSTWQRFIPPPSVPPITATSYTITGLNNGTAYVIKVIAQNATGISPSSANSASTTPAAS